MTTTMKSFYMTKYGPPSSLTFGQFPRPVIESPDQVLIKVHAASLNPVDMRVTEGTMKYIYGADEFPAKIGFDASGVIEQVGNEAEGKGWKVGDEVFVRLPGETKGSLSEYAISPERYIAKKPRNLSHVEAASLPLAGTTAYQALRTFPAGGLKGLAGKRVLVNGGMGGAGSIGVQIAEAFGAREVITTVSTSKFEKAKELLGSSVDTFIDYQKTDPTKVIEQRSLDFIFDTAGKDITKLFPLLKKDHKFTSIAAIPSGKSLSEGLGSNISWFVAKPLDLYSKFTVESPAQKAGIQYEYKNLVPNGQDLGELGKLVEEGKVKPIIGDVLGFNQEDLRKAAELVSKNGSKNGGKVVIKIVE